MTEVDVNRTKEYETIYILRPDVDADVAEKVQARVGEAVDKGRGQLVKVEAWGRRKLAYPVAKQRRGVYVYVRYLGAGPLVAELERNLKLQDAVLKFQTVLLRDQVDAATVTVDPEEIKLGRLELPDEGAHEESRERALGLLDASESSHERRPEAREADGAAPPAAATGADATAVAVTPADAAPADAVAPAAKPAGKDGQS